MSAELTVANLKKLKKKDLVELCQKHKELDTGTNAALIGRLFKHVNEEEIEKNFYVKDLKAIAIALRFDPKGKTKSQLIEVIINEAKEKRTLPAVTKKRRRAASTKGKKPKKGESAEKKAKKPKT